MACGSGALLLRAPSSPVLMTPAMGVRPSALSTPRRGLWWGQCRTVIGRGLRAIALNTDAAEMKWFVKTEMFKKPFPVVKPHLEAHRAWVAQLRLEAYPITSGYRVDANGKPGGGGLMFFKAASHEEAEKLVLQDPLVANDCVEWQLNQWIAEVGDLQLL